MQFWCKYKDGYINIDDENIYLNNTGNWSDLADVPERSGSTRKADALRRSWYGAFLYPALIAFVITFFVAIFKLGFTSWMGIAFIVLAPLGAYFSYKYLSPELGPKFRIPLSKVNSFTADAGELTLEFNDADNNAEQIKLSKIPEKQLAEIRLILLGEHKSQVPS